MKLKTYHTNTAFLDLLFCTLLLFAGLFTISFILISPTKQDKKVDAKAEFIITVTWPKDFDDDVDTYCEDPSGHLVFFRRREDGLMHLDRDDLGKRNDTIRTPYGTVIEYNENREIVTLRGIEPGEYVLNVHLYRRCAVDKGEPDHRLIPVTATIEKINPYISLVVQRTVYLESNGDELTICRFILDDEGAVTGTNELEKSLIKEFSNPSLQPNEGEENYGEEPNGEEE